MAEKRAQDTMMIQNLNILYRYVIEGVVNMKPDLYLECCVREALKVEFI